MKVSKELACVMVVAGLLSVGCGSIYYAPTTSSVATLRVTNESALGAAGGGIYDNPDCIGGKAFGFNTAAPGQSLELAVDAGSPMTLVVDGDRGSDIRLRGGIVDKAEIRRCAAPARFTPLPAGKYEAVFADDGRQCRVQLFDISTGSRRSVTYQPLVWGRASPTLARRPRC